MGWWKLRLHNKFESWCRPTLAAYLAGVFFIIFQQIETVMKVITGLPADKNFKKNFVCHPGCLALSLDQHFPVCFSWATRTIVDLIIIRLQNSASFSFRFRTIPCNFSLANAFNVSLKTDLHVSLLYLPDKSEFCVSQQRRIQNGLNYEKMTVRVCSISFRSHL